MNRKKHRDDFAASLRAQVVQPQHLSRADDVQLREFLGDFMRTKRKEVRPGAVGPYEETCGRLLADFGPRMPLVEITPRRAATFIANLQRQDDRAGELSAASKNQRLRNCKTMFDVAVEWEIIPKNPFRKVKAPKAEERPWHYWRPEEYMGLLNAAPDLRRKVVYALAYTGGLRFGEIFNLGWKNVDAKSGLTKIRYRPGTAELPEFSVKDHESREVTVPEHTLALIGDLATYRGLCGDDSPLLALEGRRLAIVRAKWQRYSAAGRPWSNQDMANNVNRDLERHMRRAKLCVPQTEAFSFHTLRKSCIQNWADAGIPMHVVQNLAGHESITTTEKYYLKTDRADMDRAAAVSQGLIAKALLGVVD